MRLRIAAAAIAGLTALAVPPGPAGALEPEEKEEIGAFIREYLIANPEIMLEVQQALEARQAERQREAAGAAIADNRQAIFADSRDPVLGNPVGDVTVVEFFDYNCGYCKRALDDMRAILESDPNVRFVLKEFPILGPDSIEAHRVSMAFHMVAPEKYGAFHEALLGGSGPADGARAFAVAAALGVDEEMLTAHMDDPQIEASIRQSYDLANAIGITGTPSYVVGEEAVFGALGADVLIEKIENVRQCESTVC